MHLDLKIGLLSWNHLIQTFSSLHQRQLKAFVYLTLYITVMYWPWENWSLLKNHPIFTISKTGKGICLSDIVYCYNVWTLRKLVFFGETIQFSVHHRQLNAFEYVTLYTALKRNAYFNNTNIYTYLFKPLRFTLL